MVTQWTEATELFMEHPPLVVNRTSRFAIQLGYELRFRNQPIGARDDTDSSTKASLVLKL